jgi:thiol-disulfide isomerase/thioredoxin
VILLLLATLYAYNTYYLPTQKNKQFQNLSNNSAGTSTTYGSGTSVSIYYFHVDWCPYCKNSIGDWNNFAKDYNNKVINEYSITCIDVNCTNDTDPNVKAYVEKYDIKGYPTVKMVKDGKVIDFDAKVTYNSLSQFVNNVV